MHSNTIHRLYELRGTLDARLIILSNDITGLKDLENELESQFYKGHTRGKIETMSAWQTDVARLFAQVEKAIREAESE